MNFKTMKTPELRQYHSDMLATTSDLDMDLPAHLCVEFDAEKDGRKICSELHELIQKRRKDGPPARTPKKEAPDMAKKSTAKKSTKKSSKKTTAARSSARGLNPEAKITVLSKENPCREGTGRYERVAALLKAGGKTVEKSGIKTGTIQWGIKQKLIKLSA